MKPFRSTLVFAIVVIGLAYFAYFDSEKAETEKAQEEAAAQVFGSLDYNDVVQLKLEVDGKTLALKKNAEGQWGLEEPVNDSADNDRVEGLITAILREKATELPVEGQIKWEAYGLDKPQSTVELSTKDGVTHKIKVGSKESFDGKIFLKKGDSEKLYLGENSWKTHSQKEVKNLRSRKVFRDELKISSFTVKSAPKLAGGTITFEKDKEGQWSLGSSKDLIIEQALVNSYVRNLQDLEANDFASESFDKAQAKKFGLDKPSVVLSLNLEGGESSSTADVVMSPAMDSKVYVKASVSPVIYEVAGTKLNLFDKGLAEFRDKKYPFSFDKEKVAEIRYADGDQKFHLKKISDHWELAEQDAKKQVNQDRVKKMIRTVNQFRVEEYFSKDKNKAIAKEDKFIEFSDETGTSLMRLVWGDKLKKEEHRPG